MWSSASTSTQCSWWLSETSAACCSKFSYASLQFKALSFTTLSKIVDAAMAASKESSITFCDELKERILLSLKFVFYLLLLYDQGQFVFGHYNRHNLALSVLRFKLLQ